MRKRILLTGVTGFVGRHVLRNLVMQDVRLTVIVRNGKEMDFINNHRIESVITTSDLFSESLEWWSHNLQGIDTVIHLAWYAEPGQYLFSSKNIDCLQGTLIIAKAAMQAEVKRFIGIGTCFEYDLSLGFLSNDTPLKPLTPYAGSKAAAYMALSQLLPSQSVEFAWCRLFYLYGEGEDSRRLVPYLRTKLAIGEPAELTSGNQIRDFLDVSEAGRMIADVVFSKIQGPINICSGIPVTLKQLAEKIADEYGRRDLLNFGARVDDLFNPSIIVGVHKG
jgi:nucleoside-diphosphate-sugar epimerase